MRLVKRSESANIIGFTYLRIWYLEQNLLPQLLTSPRVTDIRHTFMRSTVQSTPHVLIVVTGISKCYWLPIPVIENYWELVIQFNFWYWSPIWVGCDWNLLAPKLDGLHLTHKHLCVDVDSVFWATRVEIDCKGYGHPTMWWRLELSFFFAVINLSWAGVPPFDIEIYVHCPMCWVVNYEYRLNHL